MSHSVPNPVARRWRTGRPGASGFAYGLFTGTYGTVWVFGSIVIGVAGQRLAARPRRVQRGETAGRYPAAPIIGKRTGSAWYP